jgi:hypothetical protein
MSIIEWYQELSATEVLTALSSNMLDNWNNQVLIMYVILSIITRRSSLLLAFFASFLLFELSFFDPVSEVSLYLLTFVIYSYVMRCKGFTKANKLACGLMLSFCIVLAYDAFFYGKGGYYGARKTFVYNNIECISLYAHTILISSFINITRARSGLRDFIDSICHMSRNSAQFMVM